MHVREPALEFIREMAPRLATLSPYFQADDRKVGGSLMRVYRDIRFTRDKTPYKINVGIQFRHVIGRDVHAPGFYFHIEPGQSFLGAGVWRPDSMALYRIRSKIDEEQGRWKELIHTEIFSRTYRQGGESLKTTPKGFPKDPPLIDELKRKSFIAISEFDTGELLKGEIASMVTCQ